MSYLGDDFNKDEPAESSQVNQGARWIRDIKSRLKGFAGRLFNLETGEYRDNVIASESLVDMDGILVHGQVFSQVSVNSKGLVTSGEPIQDQQTAGYYRAVFFATGTGGEYVYDTAYDVIPGTGTSGTYASATPLSTGFRTSYADLNGATVKQFSFEVPLRVSRMKAIVIGAGGGADNDGTDYGGAGGEHAEATFPVTPGALINVVVGSAGGNSATPTSGGPSAVSIGSLYLEAGGGAKATNAAGGVIVSGAGSDSTGEMVVVRSPGSVGTSAVGGASGSYILGYGKGGFDVTSPQDGLVVLEWIA